MNLYFFLDSLTLRTRYHHSYRLSVRIQNRLNMRSLAHKGRRQLFLSDFHFFVVFLESSKLIIQLLCTLYHFLLLAVQFTLDSTLFVVDKDSFFIGLLDLLFQAGNFCNLLKNSLF